MKRRDFITNSAIATGAITILPRHLMGGAGNLSANDRINLGFIGVGKQSIGLKRNLSACPETMILAACDVDQKKLARFKKEAEKANGEKPLALTVGEGRAMVNATRQYNRVFQTGNMQRSWPNFRHACEMVSNGRLMTISIN